MSETEVKACPHCGSGKAPRTATAEELDPDCGYSSDNVCVVCDIHEGGCGAMSGYQRTRAQAVARWNTRTTDAENQRLREALEGAKRLLSGFKYCGWQSAGGPDECAHGYAAGIACPSCDRELIDRILGQERQVRGVLVNNGPETKFQWKEGR